MYGPRLTTFEVLGRAETAREAWDGWIREWHRYNLREKVSQQRAQEERAEQTEFLEAVRRASELRIGALSGCLDEPEELLQDWVLLGEPDEMSVRNQVARKEQNSPSIGRKNVLAGEYIRRDVETTPPLESPALESPHRPLTDAMAPTLRDPVKKLVPLNPSILQNGQMLRLDRAGHAPFDEPEAAYLLQHPNLCKESALSPFIVSSDKVTLMTDTLTDSSSKVYNYLLTDATLLTRNVRGETPQYVAGTARVSFLPDLEKQRAETLTWIEDVDELEEIVSKNSPYATGANAEPIQGGGKKRRRNESKSATSPVLRMSTSEINDRGAPPGSTGTFDRPEAPPTIVTAKGAGVDLKPTLVLHVQSPHSPIRRPDPFDLPRAETPSKGLLDELSKHMDEHLQEARTVRKSSSDLLQSDLPRPPTVAGAKMSTKLLAEQIQSLIDTHVTGPTVASATVAHPRPRLSASATIPSPVPRLEKPRPKSETSVPTTRFKRPDTPMLPRVLEPGRAVVNRPPTPMPLPHQHGPVPVRDNLEDLLKKAQQIWKKIQAGSPLKTIPENAPFDGNKENIPPKYGSHAVNPALRPLTFNDLIKREECDASSPLTPYTPSSDVEMSDSTTVSPSTISPTTTLDSEHDAEGITDTEAGESPMSNRASRGSGASPSPTMPGLTDLVLYHPPAPPEPELTLPERFRIVPEPITTPATMPHLTTVTSEPFMRYEYRSVYPIVQGHPPPPVAQHTFARNIFVRVYRYVIHMVHNWGINCYLEQVYRDLIKSKAPPNEIADVFYPASEWTGNPFLFPVERLHLHQSWLFLEDLVVDPGMDIKLLMELIHALLCLRVDGPDYFTIVRQRALGMYGTVARECIAFSKQEPFAP